MDFEHDLGRLFPCHRKKPLEHDDDEFHRGVVVVQEDDLEQGGGLSLAFLASSKAPSRMRVAIRYLTYARSIHPSNRSDAPRAEKSRASCTTCPSDRLHSM